MGYPLKKILDSLPPGPVPPIFIGVAEPLATSHGFATIDPRRRGSHCNRNILSLLEFGSSGQDRLRGKLWPLSFGGSGWHPACGLFEPCQPADCDRYTQFLRKLKSDIRDKWPDIGIKDITIRHDNSRIHTSLGHGWETCETGMDCDSSPAVQHWFGVIRLPLVRTTERLPPWPVFNQ